MHPQARSPQDDVQQFARKVKAGANAAITQYFYNPDAYFHFVEQTRKHGVDIPIVPGIMPITNYSQLMRFSDMCGTEIPRWIRLKLASYGDDTESIRAFGLDVVTELCERLLKEGAPGLHFYTLNQANATMAIADIASAQSCNKKPAISDCRLFYWTPSQLRSRAGDNHVECDVMCGAGETHQRIAVGYANADRAWLLRQRAVVEAATISQSQALGIEAQARNQQCLRLHGAARSRH